MKAPARFERLQPNVQSRIGVRARGLALEGDDGRAGPPARGARPTGRVLRFVLMVLRKPGALGRIVRGRRAMAERIVQREGVVVVLNRLRLRPLPRAASADGDLRAVCVVVVREVLIDGRVGEGCKGTCSGDGIRGGDNAVVLKAGKAVSGPEAHEPQQERMETHTSRATDADFGKQRTALVVLVVHLGLASGRVLRLGLLVLAVGAQVLIALNLNGVGCLVRFGEGLSLRIGSCEGARNHIRFKP